jgi:hypothetical protein
MAEEKQAAMEEEKQEAMEEKTQAATAEKKQAATWEILVRETEQGRRFVSFGQPNSPDKAATYPHKYGALVFAGAALDAIRDNPELGERLITAIEAASEHNAANSPRTVKRAVKTVGTF